MLHAARSTLAVALLALACAPRSTPAPRPGSENLSLHDLTMRRVVEPGSFTVWVGGSSAATREARFTVTGDTLVLAPAAPRFR